MKESKATYVGETTSLHCRDGELNIWYGDIDDQKLLVINVEQFYKDLPFIIEQVCKEQKKMQKMYLSQIKETIEKLT